MAGSSPPHSPERPPEIKCRQILFLPELHYTIADFLKWNDDDELILELLPWATHPCSLLRGGEGLDWCVHGLQIILPHPFRISMSQLIELSPPGHAVSDCRISATEWRAPSRAGTPVSTETAITVPATTAMNHQMGGTTVVPLGLTA